MFLLALLAVIGETILHAAASLSRAALHQRAVAVAQTQFSAAATEAQQTIALAIQGGADPSAIVPVMPSAAPACAMQNATGCALTAATSVTSASPMPSASGCPNTNCTIYTQNNDAVSEGRVVLAIVSTVTSPSGAVLAQRSGTIAVRTFRVPPYASMAGSLDAANGSAASTGDDGGAATGSATLVNAVYQNAVTGKLLPGNVWQSQQQSPVAVTPPWDR